MRYWKDWIEQYRYSVPELIHHTISDHKTKDFLIVSDFTDGSSEEMTTLVKRDKRLGEKEKEILISSFRELGDVLSENGTKNLASKANQLKEILKEKEVTSKERSILLFKLVPLICGAIAVILW